MNNLNPEILEVTPEDRISFKKFILDVWKEFGWTEDQIYPDLENPYDFYKSNGGILYLLKKNNLIVGSIAVTDEENKIAEISRLYLDKNVRGKGFGNKLIDLAIQFCKEKRFNKIILSSDKIFKTAHNLYQKKGFKVVKELDDEYIMELILYS